MTKLRLKENDYILLYEALGEFRSVSLNKVCADYAEQNGIEAMRLAEKQAQHCTNLMERIRMARTIR